MNGATTDVVEMPEGVDVEVTINGIPVNDLADAENIVLLGFFDSFEICATLISDNCPDGITECETFDISDFMIDDDEWTGGDWNDSTWVDNGDWEDDWYDNGDDWNWDEDEWGDWTDEDWNSYYDSLYGDWGNWDDNWDDEDWGDWEDDWSDNGDDWEDDWNWDDFPWDSVDGDWNDWGDDIDDEDDWNEGDWDWNDEDWDNWDDNWDDEDWGDNANDDSEDGTGGLVAGVEDVAPVIEWSVYPVPATSNITFKGLPEGTFAASVYDSQGRFVMNQDVQNGQTIYVSELPSGYYSIHIPALAGSMNRILVQH